MTLREALRAAERDLAGAGCDTPGLDARVLLEHVTGYETAALLIRDDEELGSRTATFADLVRRRAAREPVAYLVGHKEFFSLRFEVGPRVLVPRPETEILVEVCLAELPPAASRDTPILVADVGTGSGAIAVSLAHAVCKGPRAVAPFHLVGLDRCAETLAVAQANARRLLVGAAAAGVGVWLVLSDLTSALADASVDFLLANPPYLSPAELAAAPPELRFEPRLALDGGSGDGLGVIRELLADGLRVLRPGGRLLCEIGSDQGGEVVKIAREMGFSRAEVIRDLGGLPRVLEARTAVG